MAVAIPSILLRGFTFGIDFKGGTVVSMPVAGGKARSVAQVEAGVPAAVGTDPESVV